MPRTPEQIRESTRAAARRFHERRLGFYRGLKNGKRCMDCGESDPVCLDFHHRNPDEKEFNIGHRGRYLPRAKVLAEIAKCDVVCVNCHRKRHAKERNGDRILPPIQRARWQFFLHLRGACRCSCGVSDGVCLDYHHLDPATKSFGVANKAPTVSRERLLAEIAKCIVLCGNCHRRHHYKERQKIAA